MSRRAWSYTMQLPVRYRLDGEREWHYGMTETLSAAETVVSAYPLPQPGTAVTMILSLPATPEGLGCLVGQGCIKEAGDSDVAGSCESRFAITMASCKVDRLDDALREHTPQEFPFPSSPFDPISFAATVH
jgi:hypothetical protein